MPIPKDEIKQTVSVTVSYVDHLTDETLEVDSYVDEMGERSFMSLLDTYLGLPNAEFPDTEFSLGYDCKDVDAEYFWDKKNNDTSSGGFSSFDTPFMDITIWVREAY